MFAGLKRRARSRLAALWRDTRGVTAVFVAIGLIPLVGATGLAVDSSLGYLMRSRVSKALDTAGLAAGRVALNDDAEAVARAFFDANVGAAGSGVTITDFDFTLDPTQQFVTLTVSASAPTMFMRVFGQDTMQVNARTVIQRLTTGMELALVLDNTGSMVGAPFNAMQRAAADLVDIIYGDQTEVDNIWISLVPYVATVNIGNHRKSWLYSDDRVNDPLNTDFFPDTWKGCVMARPEHDADDAPPSVMKFSSFFYPSTKGVDANDNAWPPLKSNAQHFNDATGPNLSCGSSITPLTSSRATIDAGIAAMASWARGGTTGNLGLAWGWRTISPRWRGLWGGETPAGHPLDYDAPLTQKVVVFLTDGQNTMHRKSGIAARSDFSAYGRIDNPGTSKVAGLNTNSTDVGRSKLDSRMTGTCTAMKAQGITIFTIIFGSTPNTTTQTLFRNCASNVGNYYYAPTNAQMSQAFKAIAGELANLRIVE